MFGNIIKIINIAGCACRHVMSVHDGAGHRRVHWWGRQARRDAVRGIAHLSAAMITTPTSSRQARRLAPFRPREPTRTGMNDLRHWVCFAPNVNHTHMKKERFPLGLPWLLAGGAYPGRWAESCLGKGLQAAGCAVGENRCPWHVSMPLTSVMSPNPLPQQRTAASGTARSQ
jgi:hypothetical protein